MRPCIPARRPLAGNPALGISVIALLLVSLPTLAEPSGKQGPVPDCPRVEGIPSVGYTTDDLATLVDNDLPLTYGLATFSIVNLKHPGYMLAEHRGDVYRSRDAGCEWDLQFPAPLPDTPLRLVAGRGNLAYAHTFVWSPMVFQVGHGKRMRRLQDAPADVVALMPDPESGRHLRIAGLDGMLYDSWDRGRSWEPAGVSAIPGGGSSSVYFAAFDPDDLDHVVVGMSREGVRTTWDGGHNWETATGFSPTGGRVNAFNGVISPADTFVVYVMALDLDESASGAANRGRHIYRSDDGGMTFIPVLEEGGEIILTNGPVLAAHPENPDVVYSSFGMHPPSSVNGMWLYRYDHRTGTTEVKHREDYFGIRAITFNPADPSVIYLGFEG